MSRQRAPDTKPLAEANLRAAELQYQASQDAIALWKQQYEQQREDVMPWREAGLAALDEISEGIESGAFDAGEFDGGPEWEGFNEQDLYTDPGYQFRLDEGLRAIRRQSAAQGLTGSGATLKAISNYAQESASQEFGAARGRSLEDYAIGRERALQDYMVEQSQLDSRFNRLSALAGSGQVATRDISNIGTQSTAAQAAATQHGAAARGQGDIGAANATIQGQIYQNQARQANFNNFMQVLGLGVSAAATASGAGAFGGGGTGGIPGFG